MIKLIKLNKQYKKQLKGERNMSHWLRSSTTSERLQVAMKNAKMKQADLARATGLSKGGISNYVLGRYEPKSEIVAKLAKALNVSELWLCGFDVPMKKDIQITKSPFSPDNEERIKKLYEMTADMSDSDIENLIAFVAGLKASRKDD